VDRGDEATCGAIEGEPSVLPGRALTETCQSLRVAPHRTGIRLVWLRQRVRLAGLLLRQIESLHDCLENRVTIRSEFLARGAKNDGAVVGGVRIDRCADAIDRCPSTRPGSTRPCVGAASAYLDDRPAAPLRFLAEAL
jgi:hypothetical protein